MRPFFALSRLTITLVTLFAGCAVDIDRAKEADGVEVEGDSEPNYCVIDLDGRRDAVCYTSDDEAVAYRKEIERFGDTEGIAYSVATFASGRNLTGTHKLYLTSGDPNYCTNSHLPINYRDFRPYDFDNRLSSLRLAANCGAQFWTGVNFGGTRWEYDSPNQITDFNVVDYLDNRASSGQAF